VTAIALFLGAAVTAPGEALGATAAAPGGIPHAGASKPRFSAHGSAEQVYVTGLSARAKLSLITRSGRTLATKHADSLGGVLFRHVPPGHGYRVRLDSHGTRSGPITVHSDNAKPWDPHIYNQKIRDNGYQYLTTRDGTKLAIDVHPPTHPAGFPGFTPPPHLPFVSPPYPTLIEYSGYAYADPKGPVNGIAVLANLMGFAVVDVNMRGTGCSGGAYDFFEPLQNLDAYDVIETIAHQSWVLHHRVGMMGISYGGISQLFAAQLDPPDLAAIAPLSVIDATATTLYPGGILNSGFAVTWARERQHQAEPAGPHSGQHYARRRISAGDKVCKKNQDLHGEAANLMAKIRANSHYRPKMADPLDPDTFVHKIKVPTYIACQWEDEQTGGHCADLAQHLTGTKLKWFTFTNGPHIDSIDPYTYDRWYDFLMLFVAHRAPIENPFLLVTQAAAPAIYMAAMAPSDWENLTLPPDPVQTALTYSSALAKFKQQPEIRVLFDNGAGKSPDRLSEAGDPYPAFEKSFKRFPIPGTKAHYWYLGAGGTLGARPSKKHRTDVYTSDANALPLTDYPSYTTKGTPTLWGNASSWKYRWKQYRSGNAVSYVSAPLKHNLTVIGGGAVHVWVRSSTADVDLQATVTEVRPDGNETFVQNGWIRASERKLATGTDDPLDQNSTLLEPIPSMEASDVQPMPKNRFVKVVVPLYFEGHVYRAGSRVRLVISAPNGTQPVWSFNQTEPRGKGKVWVTFSRSMPSSLILPVVPGVSVPSGLPACPSLRNEPCRRYVALKNKSG
jgi:predicted acyl esterase